MDQPPRNESRTARIVAISAAVFGAVVAAIVGMPLQIVAIFSIGVGIPLYLVTSGPNRRMVPAGAVQAGHALWVLLGGILLAVNPVRGAPAHSAILFEGGLFLLGSLLLICWPELVMILTLTVYQVVTFLINLRALAGEEVSGEAANALLAHLCLRVLAVALMYEAYFRNLTVRRAEVRSLPKPRLLRDIIAERSAEGASERSIARNDDGNGRRFQAPKHAGLR